MACTFTVWAKAPAALAKLSCNAPRATCPPVGKSVALAAPITTPVLLASLSTAAVSAVAAATVAEKLRVSGAVAGAKVG